MGAVLEQVRDDGTHVPVAFWSRILAEGQRRTWTAREKETYAIVCALRKWSGHIGLQPVVVCTDHQSLQSWHKEHVDTPSGPAARRARWHETFAKFDLSVLYVPGKDNTVADCLSRWAYPAGKAWMDISSHGDAGETEEAKRIIEMEKAIGVLPSSLQWLPSGNNALRRGLKPVRTPVAIFGSLGVCIYVPASRHWLISYSPIHLT